MTHAKASLDPDFLKLRSELDHWRSTKKGHRIPDFLWHEAIRLTHQYGKQQVLRTLGLSPESFKQRTEKSARDQCQQVKRGPIEQPAFVEIPLTPPDQMGLWLGSMSWV